MVTREELKSEMVQFNGKDSDFERLALATFEYQYQQNPVYRKFSDLLGKNPSNVTHLNKIPFLPIDFFKKHPVISGNPEAQAVFESSGTTSTTTGRHYVADLPLYNLMSQKTFESFYGPLTDYHIFALLPSYLERNNSSLIYMVEHFIHQSYSSYSGFFLRNINDLTHQMAKAANDNRKILLIGVSFALLDLAEDLKEAQKIQEISDRLIVMETGGMKGRRKELVREELHQILCDAFHVKSIHSEYGMTELLSQGYSKGEGIFNLPPIMKVLIREVNDPFSFLPYFKIGKGSLNRGRKTGGINVIDLANIDSCSFIETQDLGEYTPDYKGFKIVGRFDTSDLRGCNLLVS